MNLFYTVNDAFVPQLGAAVCSVCTNNRDAEEIVFYIGDLHISAGHREQLTALAGGYGREIIFLPINNLRERLGFDFDTTGWNEVVLARLLADRLLPEMAERVIYLDGDTIVRGSLKELWETDLQGKTIGAVEEPTANHKRKKELGLEGKPYYNAGVLLIDLKRWKERHIAERVLEFYKAHGGMLFANDQDAINGAVPEEILSLNPKYNYCNIFWHYKPESLARIAEPAKYLTKEELAEVAKDPRIIHYLGEERPWRRGNRHRYREDYRRNLDLTPWKDTPDETGWETYFRFYDAFWTVLKPFPMLQYHIIDALIPYMMNRRKAGRLKREQKEKEGRA